MYLGLLCIRRVCSLLEIEMTAFFYTDSATRALNDRSF